MNQKRRVRNTLLFGSVWGALLVWMACWYDVTGPTVWSWILTVAAGIVVLIYIYAWSSWWAEFNHRSH